MQQSTANVKVPLRERGELVGIRVFDDYFDEWSVAIALNVEAGGGRRDE